MPITVKKMAENTATVSISWGEDTVAITYYPSQVTEGTLAELDKPDFTIFNETLSQIMKSWDVLDEDGSMYPIDPDHLAALALKFRTAIARAIIQDIRPND